MMRVTALSVALLLVLVALELLRSSPSAVASTGSSFVPPTPVPGVTAETSTPGAPSLGVNDWSCKPSAARPEPVVLVHGLLANLTEWQVMAPLLAHKGYCVFALTYGTVPGLPFPLDHVGGLLPMEQSAQELSGFIDAMLSATGAQKVDIVGHSEGATMPYYYVKFLGGAAKVNHYVGLGPGYHGTTVDGLAPVVSLLGQLVLGAAQTVAGICGACPESVPGSAFLKALDADASAVTGPTYTNIVTRYDEVVTPYTSGFLNGPNVTNIVLQDQCGLDFSDHVALAADPVAAQDVLNALDPQRAMAPACGLVLPLLGG
jgi:triacylglycerol esterase/lipase EstA (alpha/beta hydrolase family)